MTEPTDSQQNEQAASYPTIAEELAKLWTALSAMTVDLGAAAHNVAPACTGLAWCPLCRASSLVNQCSPEVVDHLSSAAKSLLLALSAALKTDPPAGKQGFERINLGDESDQTKQSE